MTDILLATAFFIKNDPKQLEKMQPYAPLGTLYAANHLRQAGYTIAVFDAMLANGVEEFETLLNDKQPRIVAFYEDLFNYLNKMCLNHVRESLFKMAKLAKAQNTIVIAAGSDLTDEPEAYFAQGVDYIMNGEADHTLLELCDAILNSKAVDCEKIHGVCFPQRVVGKNKAKRSSESNVLMHSPRRALEKNLDVFPQPAWDLLDAERYRRAWQDKHGFFSTNMVASRGCSFHCNWCAKPLWGQHYATRSESSVAKEMALVKQLFNPDHLWFADDIFGMNPKWVVRFAAEVEKHNAQIPFMIQSRVDLMTEKAVNALAQAGCKEVWMGVESGSQKILDAMEKGTYLTLLPEVRQRLAHAGIKTCFFIQFGYPGEGLAEIKTTIQLVRDNLPDDIGISVSYPLPGTRFYERVANSILKKHHWQDSNDLDVMFKASYKTPFYKQLHTLLHKDLDLRIALKNARPADNDLIGNIAELEKQKHDLELEWRLWEASEARFRNENPTTFPIIDKYIAADRVD